MKTKSDNSEVQSHLHAMPDPLNFLLTLAAFLKINAISMGDFFSLETALIFLVPLTTVHNQSF